MRSVLRILGVSLTWGAVTAFVGALVFTYVWVEHGSVLIWIALCIVGLILGVVHGILRERRKELKVPGSN
jgi:hypothetical protein